MTPQGFLNNLDRRTFLKIASLTGLGGLILPRGVLSSMGPLDTSRVVLIEDSAATSGTTVDPVVAQSMMDCGITTYTGLYDVGGAWKSLFPGIDATNVIAIKVNCINSSLSTHPAVANAVANGLAQMMFGGTPFPANNIIIFDRTNGELTSAGYTLNTSTTGVRCFGTNASGVGYSTETYDVNSTTQRLSTIVTEMADYIVNASVLKNHNMAGVTLSMKNHYGTCNSPGSLHGGDCDPYIPELNSLGPIRDKQRVNICDALLGIYTGGPSGSPQFAANTLIISQDTVATDYWGREILEDNGCTTISDAHHIETAAGAPYNLGTNDPGQMDVQHIVEPSGIDDPAARNGFALKQNEPNPFHDRTSIRFHVPGRAAVTLAVFNPEGRRIRQLADRTVASGWHRLDWDGRTDAGGAAAPGVYYCRLRTGDFDKSVIMQKIR
jgi:uncharacterized protein (DUF362 family)